MNYTKGPWKVKAFLGIRHIYVVPSDYDKNLQERDGFGICELLGEVEKEANARLIAAAPELLEVCKFALDNERCLPIKVANHLLIDKIEKVIASTEKEGIE